MSVRGPYAKGVAKRAEILAAALEIIGRDGYSKATVRELADAVGLTPNGVLHYFGSKEALLTAVVQARDFRADRQDGPPSPESVVAGYPAFIGASAEVPGLIQLFSRLANEATESGHSSHQYFADRYGALRGLWTGVFAEFARMGRLRPGQDPEVLATMLIALTDGLQTQWLYDPTVDMPAAVAEFFRMVDAGRSA